jgi:hypothetical protein
MLVSLQMPSGGLVKSTVLQLLALPAMDQSQLKFHKQTAA